MIAAASHPVWAKLVKGEVQHSFKLASASMFTFSLQQQWKRAPEKLPDLIEQARQFFTKYEAIATADLSALFR